MSTSDKTRTKLMDSMRKTKESANAQSTEPAAQSEPKPAAKAAPKSAAKTTTKSAPAKKTATQKEPGNFSNRVSGETDGYQSGGRIWPD